MATLRIRRLAISRRGRNLPTSPIATGEGATGQDSQTKRDRDEPTEEFRPSTKPSARPSRRLTKPDKKPGRRRARPSRTRIACKPTSQRIRNGPTPGSMWRLAQDYPRHQAAFNALIWLVEQGPRFFDSRPERDAVLSQVVDVLIRDHLETIADHLADRNVAMALSMGEPTAGRLTASDSCGPLQARPRPQTSGRMGLDPGPISRGPRPTALSDSTAPGAERGARGSSSSSIPPFVDQLRKADRQAIAQQAEEVLNRVIADYGDVAVRTARSRPPTHSRPLPSVSCSRSRVSRSVASTEIEGKDVDGKPMKLSEFRGKVVLLDFGSHEHCGGCKVVYPRLRATLDRLRGRPFAILGINNFDQPRQAQRGDRPRRNHLAMLVGRRQTRSHPARSPRAGTFAAIPPSS